MTHTIDLKLTRAQAEIVARALECLGRFASGQLPTAAELALCRIPTAEQREALVALKGALFPDLRPNESLSVSCLEVPIIGEAVTIMEALTYAMAEDDVANGKPIPTWHTSRQPPHQWGANPIPKVTIQNQEPT